MTAEITEKTAMKPSAEETLIIEQYRAYQHGTQGIDIWEEGAFRAGWRAHEEHATNSVEQFKRGLELEAQAEETRYYTSKDAPIEYEKRKYHAHLSVEQFKKELRDELKSLDGYTYCNDDPDHFPYGYFYHKEKGLPVITLSLLEPKDKKP